MPEDWRAMMLAGVSGLHNLLRCLAITSRFDLVRLPLSAGQLGQVVVGRYPGLQLVEGGMVDSPLGDGHVRRAKEDCLAIGAKGEGGTVTSESKVWDNDTRALGVAPLVGTEVCVVENGQIQSLTWTMSEESLAALGAALAALPQTGGETLPDYAWIVVLGGLTFAGGLGIWKLGRRARQTP